MSDAAAELARMVEEVSGNVVPPAHLPFLARAAETRVRATGHRDLAGYVAALRRGALAGEWSALLPLVTINESYFFRTPQHFDALVRTVLPDLLAARAASRRLRFWSAGCARGEEPATLAIVLAEMPAAGGWDWRVLATDVDEEALAAARRGAYTERAVAQVAGPLRDRHFARRGDQLVLSPALRSHIDYRVLNLVREPFADPGGPFDVIFLRNVLIYFRGESQRRVAATIATTLAPDGFLFLGPAETLWQISDDLEPVDLGDCFCYRKRSPLSPTRWSVASGQWSDPGTKIQPPGALEKQGRRVVPKGARRETRAGARDLASAAPGRSIPATDHRPLTTDHAVVGTRERLAEAARHLLDDRLAEAVALLDEALAADPGEPEAHVLEGFIHDVTGRSELAIASFRAALYLDPSLYQARLLLADALRRLAWEERATAEYRAVLARLATGNVRELTALQSLPLPDRSGAGQRARKALHRSASSAPGTGAA